MLSHAGVDFTAIGAEIDEEAVKAAGDDPAGLASRLAEAKAVAVSRSHPHDLVIGSDSVVSVDGRIFSKPKDRDEAANHLRIFSGKAMVLTSAVALAREAGAEWTFCDSATLGVRRLSERFIEDYLEAEWPEVGYCVGVFRLEGRGVQLFDSIDGSYFTILGMPLVPLLGALRERGAIAA